MRKIGLDGRLSDPDAIAAGGFGAAGGLGAAGFGAIAFGAMGFGAAGAAFGASLRTPPQGSLVAFASGIFLKDSLYALSFCFSASTSSGVLEGASAKRLRCGASWARAGAARPAVPINNADKAATPKTLMKGSRIFAEHTPRRGVTPSGRNVLCCTAAK